MFSTHFWIRGFEYSADRSFFFISGASLVLIPALLINLFVLLFGVDEFSFFLEKIEILFFEETRFSSGVFFFHFLVFLSFCTVGHRFVVFVFEKHIRFLEMELILASVIVTLSDQYQLRLTRHNSFHSEFVLRELSYDHLNAAPSLLLRFFSLVILFSKC